MNESESRASGALPAARASGNSHLMAWVVVLALPVTIIVLGVAFELFGLVVRLLGE